MSKAIQFKDNGENVYPIALERIENSNGTALKFADGTLICYGTFNITDLSWSGWGQDYAADKYCHKLFPISFKDTPVISVTTSDNALNCWVGRIRITSTEIASVCLIRPTSTTITSCSARFIAVGRWR